MEVPRDVRISKDLRKQNQEILVSALEYMLVPQRDRTIGILHPLQMFFGDFAQLGRMSNSVWSS